MLHDAYGTKVALIDSARLTSAGEVVTPAQAAAILAELKETVILILANPADENETTRIAVSDPGVPNEGKPTTSTKKK